MTPTGIGAVYPRYLIPYGSPWDQGPYGKNPDAHLRILCVLILFREAVQQSKEAFFGGVEESEVAEDFLRGLHVARRRRSRAGVR